MLILLKAENFMSAVIAMPFFKCEGKASNSKLVLDVSTSTLIFRPFVPFKASTFASDAERYGEIYSFLRHLSPYSKNLNGAMDEGNTIVFLSCPVETEYLKYFAFAKVGVSVRISLVCS